MPALTLVVKGGRGRGLAEHDATILGAQPGVSLLDHVQAGPGLDSIAGGGGRARRHCGVLGGVRPGLPRKQTLPVVELRS